MASKSRAAQEALAELEKGSASFEDQLSEAWKFVGVDPENAGRFIGEAGSLGTKSSSSFHGREEWLLRWLLKKLQSHKDDTARQIPSSWKLLCHLVHAIPTTNAAQILSEKKFISMLKQTLEDVQRLAKDVNEGTADANTRDDATNGINKSKKRKRSGEPAASSNGRHNKLAQLLQAISAALGYISSSTKITSDVSGKIGGGAFAAEYTKAVLTTTPEEAAKILGSWLFLSQVLLSDIRSVDSTARKLWLLPFIEIWELRTVGTEDLMQFSLYSSQYLLSLLQILSQPDHATLDWTSELEQLVARNIIIPAKIARADDGESDLLSMLTRVSIIQDSANASLLFSVAIRSLQPHGSRRRRPQDDAWLQHVFAVFREAMPPKRIEGNTKAIQRMFQSAISHKVTFEIPLLQSVTSQYALAEDFTDWSLLSTILKLDSNTFLIPYKETRLLQEVLTRITAVSIQSTWSDIYDQVITSVVVPLMNEFAKARDLSGFLRHWYLQLVEFESLREDDHLLFGAWEDEALQSELRKLLESSLTLHQISELMDWLENEVKVHPDAACVILEALAGSITREEVVDTVGLRLYYIMFGGGGDVSKSPSESLCARYKWRSWRLLSRTISWAQSEELEAISELWERNQRPFDSLKERSSSSGLLEVAFENETGLETLEVLRFACSAWNFAQNGDRLQDQAGKTMLSFFRLLASDVDSFMQKLLSRQEIGGDICDSNLNAFNRKAGWIMWSFIRCLFVEYPKVLQLGPQLPGDIFKDFLLNIFWIASSSCSNANIWLESNSEAFSKLWNCALLNRYLLDNPGLRESMINTMLSCQSNIDNPLVESPVNNTMAITSLLILPLERFTKKDRERVMKAWLPTPESTALDHGVLSLKAKVMRRPTLYEGIKFSDLIDLAIGLANATEDTLQTNLGLFKDLAKSTFMHVTENLDQSRNRAYTLEAQKYIHKKTKTKKPEDEKPKSDLNFGLVALFEVVLAAFESKAKILNDLDIISTKDLSKLSKSLKKSLLEQLTGLLQKPNKFLKGNQVDQSCLLISSIIDALAPLSIKEKDLEGLVDVAEAFVIALTNTQQDIVMRLRSFIFLHAHKISDEAHLECDIGTIYGRQSIKEMANALTTGQSQQEKLALLRSFCGHQLTGSIQLNRLLEARFIIASCEDSRRLTDDETPEEDIFDLSSAYADLCSRYWRAEGYRHFALVGETMEMMLRTKGRTISQWNIDRTLGDITIICSRNGPSLRSCRSGAIYTHLCRLLQAVLTSHRLKLQGHFHLVVQAMQALLRCLFTPLPHSTSRITKLFAPPPWLSAPNHQLRAKHAEKFTRLVTLICNPSVSSVTRSQINTLTSATEKAKKMAGQHMQYVLTLYIKLQLEMKMLPEVREKMTPGIYAIFDSTTPELRRAITDGLDPSGREVYKSLLRDYNRFGKWNGS